LAQAMLAQATRHRCLRLALGDWRVGGPSAAAMSHGLHCINHTVVADGSGRDLNIFRDPMWRMGNLNGAATVPAYHPILRRGERPKAYMIEGEHPRKAAIKADPAAADHPTTYRLNGNASITFLPKKDVEAKYQAQTLKHMKRTGSLPDMTSRGTPAKRTWRTRELMTSYECWHRQHPPAVGTGRLPADVRMR